MSRKKRKNRSKASLKKSSQHFFDDWESPVIPVHLARCESAAEVSRVLPELLDKVDLWPGRSLRGANVLVKPNLLRSVKLACTEPAVVAEACRYLMDRGAKVHVSDSPGFGTAKGVARAIGLEDALKPLGLEVEPMGKGLRVIFLGSYTTRLSKTAFEADLVLSTAKIKAHSQMRLTAACKNLYGCIPGIRKALHHAREGEDPERFASLQANMLKILPQTAALVDGIVCMHRTGPSGGAPYELGLLGASSSPVAMDQAIAHLLGARTEDIPLLRAFLWKGHPDLEENGAKIVYPDLKPSDFDAEGFELPKVLLHTSFKPWRLLKSCLKRLWQERFS